MGWFLPPLARKEKARCREEVAAGLISNTAREEVYRTQRRHHIWEEETADTEIDTRCL